jgi:hypothetical protein
VFCSRTMKHTNMKNLYPTLLHDPKTASKSHALTLIFIIVYFFYCVKNIQAFTYYIHKMAKALNDRCPSYYTSYAKGRGNAIITIL